MKVTNNEINALVAEKVAGGKNTHRHDYYGMEEWEFPNPHFYDLRPCPDYLHNANAVEELLRKMSHWEASYTQYNNQPAQYFIRVYPKGWLAGDYDVPTIGADTFCRAACLAMLRANRVFVE